jgi:putative tricarboxylic transport membrane protein
MANSTGVRRWVHPVDLVLSAAILLFVAFFAYMSTTFEEVSALFDGGITPEYFPRLLLWIIAILAVLLPFEHAWRVARTGGSGLEEDRKRSVKPIAFVTMAVALVIVGAAEWMGTYLTLIVICCTLPAIWGERRWIPMVAFGLGFPTAVMVLFTQVFKIYFQPGVLGLNFY